MNPLALCLILFQLNPGLCRSIEFIFAASCLKKTTGTMSGVFSESFLKTGHEMAHFRLNSQLPMTFPPIGPLATVDLTLLRPEQVQLLTTAITMYPIDH